ncbi:MAG: DUF2924 domain-containing protein [Rickettsiales bacterium]
MTISIIRQVIELENKSSSELRQMYKNLFTTEVSSMANKDQLRHKIAYRLQELEFGGLSAATKDKLEAIAKGKTLISKTKHRDLLPGTRICKEYNGCLHQVEVRQDGFEYNGQKWNSLSAVATKITGTKWNGPKFFGMRG